MLAIFSCRIMFLILMFRIIKDVVYAYFSINYNSSSIFSITYINQY